MENSLADFEKVDADLPYVPATACLSARPRERKSTCPDQSRGNTEGLCGLWPILTGRLRACGWAGLRSVGGYVADLWRLVGTDPPALQVLASVVRML